MTTQDRLAVDLLEHSRNAESVLLGCCLRYADAFAEAVAIVRAEDFAAKQHEYVFRAMHELFTEGVRVEMKVVWERILRRGWQDEFPGASLFLVGLFDAAGSGGIDTYAQAVLGYSVRRQLISAARQIERNAISPVGPEREILEDAERQIFGIAERQACWDVAHISTAVNEARDEYDRRYRKETTWLTTGFIDLDAKTAGGLHPGELWIIAARTSVGKTAIALNIARNVSAGGNCVLVCSLEQSRRELAERMVCSLGSIDLKNYRMATMDDGELSRAMLASDRLVQSPVLFDDFPGQGMTRIISTARRVKMRHNLKLVIVDYLQLIEPERGRGQERRHEQVAAMSRRLKFLARELDIPVIALAQLSRAAEDRDEPRLSDLRESGSLEQDADVVALLYRADQERFPKQITLKIGKNRNGPLGNVVLLFDDKTTTFYNYAPDAPDVYGR